MTPLYSLMYIYCHSVQPFWNNAFSPQTTNNQKSTLRLHFTHIDMHGVKMLAVNKQGCIYKPCKEICNIQRLVHMQHYASTAVWSCVCVCHKSVFYWNAWMDWASFLPYRLLLTYVALCYKKIPKTTKIRVLLSIAIINSGSKKNFITAYRSSQCIVNLAWQRWTHSLINWTVVGQQNRQYLQQLTATRGDHKVLQLGYKKLTYYITHTVIFWHILLQNLSIFSSFLLSCLHLEIVFLFWLANHASTAIFSDSLSINQVPQTLYFRFLIRK